LTRQERRMLDGIEREDIFVTRSGREGVGDYLTGVLFDRVAFAGPDDDLSDVSTGQGNNTLIIVNGTLVTTETEDIQGVQTIQGGGSTIPVFGVRSGTVSNFTASATAATIDSTAADDVLALQGNHTHIAGLDIDGNDTVGGAGINVGSNKSADPIGPGTWNIVIDQTDVHDLNWDGITLGDNNANVLIFNETTITDAEFGIFASDGNTNVQITGVDISTIDKDGIFFDFQNSNIIISETTIADVGWAGIGLQNSNDDIHITGVNISNPSLEGIHLNIGNSNVEISEATIDNAGTDGIMSYINNTAVRITNSTITASNVGISIGQQPAEGLFNGGGNDVTIENTTIDGSGEAGLLVIGDDPNTITMNNTTFTGAFGDDVIHIDSDNNDLSGGGNVDNSASGTFCNVTGSGTSGFFGFPGGPSDCPVP